MTTTIKETSSLLKRAAELLLEHFNLKSEVAEKLLALADRMEHAEPVAWMFQHDETGRTTFDTDGAEFAKNNPRWNCVGPVYTSPQPSQVPEGWQLVPIEPTHEMLIASRDWSYDKYGKPIGDDAAIGCYRVMFAAALKEPK